MHNDDALSVPARHLATAIIDFQKPATAEANYTEWLSQLATTRGRILIGDVTKREPYLDQVREENYGFLRTQAVFKKCMAAAHDRWKWVHLRLQ